MATHYKDHIFIRIIAHNNSVICINPHQLSSFKIDEKAIIKTKTPEGEKSVECQTIRLYFPSGMGLAYSVGIDITQEEFNYICATLLEFLYLNEAEHKAKTEALNLAKMGEWNKLSAENEAKLSTPATEK